METLGNCEYIKSFVEMSTVAHGTVIFLSPSFGKVSGGKLRRRNSVITVREEFSYSQVVIGFCSTSPLHCNADAFQLTDENARRLGNTVMRRRSN